MTNKTNKILATVFALALAMTVLGACSSQQPAESSSASPDASTPAATLDVSSMNTLGDLLALNPENAGYGWNDQYIAYAGMVDGNVIRATAEMAPDTVDQLRDLSFDDPEYDKKQMEILGGLELLSIENLSENALSPEELNSLIGKTGQELHDAGFGFSSYSMYGGEATMATMDYKMLAYNVTFDGTVTEEQTEDEGAALKDLKVTEIEFWDAADSAMDPELVK